MIINGKAYQAVNIRTAPKVVDFPSNKVGKLLIGQTFVGSDLVYETPTQAWIKLASINGIAISGNQYVAAWVVEYKIEPVPPSPGDDPIVSAVVIQASGKRTELVTK